MLNFYDGVKHLYQPKLNEVTRYSMGVNNWLKEGKGYFIDQDQGNNEFSISAFDLMDFLEPYAFDINRISCASIESILEVKLNTWQPKSLGWTITKFYYSAFFAAHCILRLFGKSLSNLESDTLRKISLYSNGYGFNGGTLSGGLYCTEISTSSRKIRFYKNSHYDNSHEGLWKYFLHFWTESKNRVYDYLPIAEAQNIVEKIEELVSALQNWGSNGGNWLSRIRNSVNYSHTHGIWFPYNGYLPEYEHILSNVDLYLLNPLEIDLQSYKGKDLVYFVKTCQLINSILNELIKDLKSKHPSNKSFLKNGVIMLQNLYSKGMAK